MACKFLFVYLLLVSEMVGCPFSPRQAVNAVKMNKQLRKCKHQQTSVKVSVKINGMLIKFKFESFRQIFTNWQQKEKNVSNLFHKQVNFKFLSRLYSVGNPFNKSVQQRKQHRLNNKNINNFGSKKKKLDKKCWHALQKCKSIFFCAEIVNHINLSLDVCECVAKKIMSKNWVNLYYISSFKRSWLLCHCTVLVKLLHG